MADKSTPAIDTVRPSPRHAATCVYVARLLRSTWKAVIAKEERTPAGYSILPAVPLEKLRTVQEALSTLQRFFQANKSFIKGLSGPDDLSRAGNRNDEVAMQGEHRALHSIVKFVSDAIEGISFILVLFEERVADVVSLLPEQSRAEFLKLTFEELFSTHKGHDLAKELVKAIVNRNIAKGSNVETVAEALRRRCGRFCSQEDVVIFKAQELLKRAAEAGSNAEFARNLLNESLKLFEKVADSLPADYLDSAVKQYTELQFFAGAITLVLKVAHELDKGNEALTWMADGRPDSDPRKAKFEQRTRGYDLIHGVIDAVDQSVQQGPTFVDGRPTLIATRRNEAYDVISKSKDEVFLTNLYDWYLSQGWYDRLLATDSPFIVTYLKRKAADDLLHADLLWKYYGQNHQYYEAAQCQLQLATSSFDLRLDRRIEYLSRARANASTYVAGGNRKSKQRLLQEISDLLDAANIQDEILARLKDDPRLPPERRPDVLGHLDGPILTISELFNEFADNVGYYDLCLLIYQVSDTRDPAMIKQTWQQYLQTIHDGTVEKGEPQPFEAIAEGVRTLGARLRASESVFPVHMLVPILMKYSHDHQRNVAPPHWVQDIFISLAVPYERLFDVLEAMFFAQEPPFIGSTRKMVSSDLIYVVEKWMHDTSRGAGLIFDSEAGAARVDQMMDILIRAGPQGGVDPEMAQKAREIRQAIARISG
jgi:nuclear pore complex protein Nup155